MNRFKRVLMIDNFDSFTFNLVDYLEQLQCEVKVYRNIVDPSIIDEVKPDLIVISPGPSVPKNAGNLMKMIEVSYKTYPILGVCLGLEALVESFGGSLKLVTPVHGKSSAIHHDGKTIFTGLPQDFLGGRYHSLATDRLPDCFDVSATSTDLIMAIRHKTLPIEGVQFHPESVLTMKGGNGFKLMENVIHKRFTHA
jgi:anthranilate synthase/aminodeoxychorismate synthase-like glutamine amidotransferase